MSHQPSIVITGMGVVAPNGIGVPAFLDALRHGRSGIDEIRAFDTTDWPVHRGGEVTGLPASYLELGLPGRTSLLAWLAAIEALEDAGLDRRWPDPSRVGLIVGTTSGEIQAIEEVDERWARGQAESVSPGEYVGFASHAIAATLAARLGARGPVLMIANACASGNFAVSYARDLIREGDADVVIVGGADAFSKVALAGFSRVHAVAPEKCQPFSKDRKGMMVSEGAGMVVLEGGSDARRRGAAIHAEVLGTAVGCDAFHLTAPDPEGMAAVMRRALEDARVAPAAVGYISAHGTGTAANDAAETAAIKRVFGPLADRVPVSSIKSMIGHTMGAASAIETVACCLALVHGFLPPTVNYDQLDPECDLDYVPGAPRLQAVDVIMNNSFAFGGNNASVILGRARGMTAGTAILGLGVVSPIGIGVEAFWAGLLAGRDAQGPIEGFDVSPLATRTGIQVHAADFDAGELLGRKGLKYVDRVSQFALAATQLALQHAAVDLEAIPAERRGIVLGTAFGSLASQQDLNRERIADGPAWVSPMKFPNTPINALSYQIPIRHQMRLANVTIPAGGVSALEAMRYSMTLLAREPEALILTGGIEELSFLNYYSASQRGLLAGTSGVERSRPLDRGRDGLVFGEGAAVFAVGTAGRHGPPLAFVDGHGRGFADPGDTEAARASAVESSMRAALKRAGCAPAEVGLVVLSANGSPADNRVEAVALGRVFGEGAVPVTAPKAVLGESFGAAGALGVAVAVLAMTHGMLPPVHHLDELDAACAVDAVRPPGRAQPVTCALVNGVDAMGSVASILLRRPRN